MMHVGHAHDTKYFMTEYGVSKQLEVTNEERDLGITVTNDLKPADSVSRQQREHCQ